MTLHWVATDLKIVFVSSGLPRRCGMATFSADLMAAVKAADPRVTCLVAAIDEPNEGRRYGGEVRWRIRQGDALLQVPGFDCAQQFVADQLLLDELLLAPVANASPSIASIVVARTESRNTPWIQREKS
jgi:hypothetical protein